MNKEFELAIGIEIGKAIKAKLIECAPKIANGMNLSVSDEFEALKEMSFNDWWVVDDDDDLAALMHELLPGLIKSIELTSKGVKVNTIWD